MITYKVWSELLYECVVFWSCITIWSVFGCLLLSILTIPLDVLLSPIEILSLIIYGIIELIEKIKEKKND